MVTQLLCLAACSNPLIEEIFANIQPKPSLAQLEAISSCPIPCCLGEGACSTSSSQSYLKPVVLYFNIDCSAIELHLPHSEVPTSGRVILERPVGNQMFQETQLGLLF